MFMRKHSTGKRSFKLAAVLAPVLATVSLLAVGSSAANASITLGGSGTMGGSAYCDTTRHTISIVYVATPGVTEDPTSTLGLMKVVPEWVEVYTYVKSHSSSNWGSPVAHGYAYVDRQTTLISTQRYGTAGAYYDVAFVARAAYPGGQWSSWITDMAQLSTSYSGSVFANYGYCRT
jgi:hypothetical protein